MPAREKIAECADRMRAARMAKDEATVKLEEALHAVKRARIEQAQAEMECASARRELAKIAEGA